MLNRNDEIFDYNMAASEDQIFTLDEFTVNWFTLFSLIYSGYQTQIL
jgi:hypothetical protein